MKALFRDHRNSVSDVFKWEDPLPALGVLYPLAVFLKHGKVSTELLVSEEGAGMKGIQRLVRGAFVLALLLSGTSAWTHFGRGPDAPRIGLSLSTDWYD